MHNKCMIFYHVPTVTISEVNFSDLSSLAEIKLLAPLLRNEEKKNLVNSIDPEAHTEATRLLIGNWQNNIFDTLIKATDKNNKTIGYLSASNLEDKEHKTSQILEFYTLPVPEKLKPGRGLIRYYFHDMHARNVEEIVLTSTVYAKPIYQHYGFTQCHGGMSLSLQKFPEYKIYTPH